MNKSAAASRAKVFAAVKSYEYDKTLQSEDRRAADGGSRKRFSISAHGIPRETLANLDSGRFEPSWPGG